MSHVPLVSIWIPSYNHARFLPATLDSALGQTFEDTEVVVVDDGSTDDSFQIAEAYAARYPRKVRLFTHPGRRNLGISETVNLAVEKVRGRYAFGLPSDDVLYPEKVAAQFEFLERNPGVGWAYGLMTMIDEEGRELPGRGAQGRDFTRDPDPLESLIARNEVTAPTAMTRRECILKAGPHDPALVYSDWDYWVRLLAVAKVGFIPRPLVKYRVHSYNTSLGGGMARHLRHCAEVVESLKRRAAERAGGPLARPRTRALLDLQAAFYARLMGDEPAAARSLSAAFETDPSLGRAPAYFAAWLRERLRDIAQAPVPGVGAQTFGSWVVGNLPGGLGGGFVRRAAAVACAGAAVESFDTDLGLARRMALRCVARDPSWLGDAALRSVLVRGLAGAGLMRRLRRLKKSVRGPERA